MKESKDKSSINIDQYRLNIKEESKEKENNHERKKGENYKKIIKS